MKFVAGIVVATLVMAGAWYAVSKPFHAEVTQLIASQTEWTDERVQADPAGFLGWAADACDDWVGQLDARKLGLLTIQSQTRNTVVMEQSRRDAFATTFEQLRGAWRRATAARVWPATLPDGQSADEPALREAVVDAADHVGQMDADLARCRSELAEVERDLQDAAASRAEATRLRATATTELEHVRLRQTIADLSGVRGRVEGLRARVAAVSVVAAGDAGVGRVDVASLAGRAGAAGDLARRSDRLLADGLTPTAATAPSTTP